VADDPAEAVARRFAAKMIWLTAFSYVMIVSFFLDDKGRLRLARKLYVLFG
jgi:hypothetical protein